MGTTKKEKREKALERYSILWAYYYENGSITTRDCLNLLQVNGIGFVIKSFEYHDLDFPPRRDETRVRVKRNADMLNEFARKKGVTELTTDEMAEALERPVNSVHYARRECERHGFIVPELKIKDEWRRVAYGTRKADKKVRMDVISEDVEMQPEYLDGFLVVEGRTRVNPDNSKEVIYMLR